MADDLKIKVKVEPDGSGVKGKLDEIAKKCNLKIGVDTANLEKELKKVSEIITKYSTKGADIAKKAGQEQEKALNLRLKNDKMLQQLKAREQELETYQKTIGNTTKLIKQYRDAIGDRKERNDGTTNNVKAYQNLMYDNLKNITEDTPDKIKEKVQKDITAISAAIKSGSKEIKEIIKSIDNDANSGIQTFRKLREFLDDSSIYKTVNGAAKKANSDYGIDLEKAKALLYGVVDMSDSETDKLTDKLTQNEKVLKAQGESYLSVFDTILTKIETYIGRIQNGDPASNLGEKLKQAYQDLSLLVGVIPDDIIATEEKNVSQELEQIKTQIEARKKEIADSLKTTNATQPDTQLSFNDKEVSGQMDKVAEKQEEITQKKEETLEAEQKILDVTTQSIEAQKELAEQADIAAKKQKDVADVKPNADTTGVIAEAESKALAVTDTTEAKNNIISGFGDIEEIFTKLTSVSSSIKQNAEQVAQTLKAINDVGITDEAKGNVLNGLSGIDEIFAKLSAISAAAEQNTEKIAQIKTITDTVEKSVGSAGITEETKNNLINGISGIEEVFTKLDAVNISMKKALTNLTKVKETADAVAEVKVDPKTVTAARKDVINALSSIEKISTKLVSINEDIENTVVSLTSIKEGVYTAAKKAKISETAKENILNGFTDIEEVFERLKTVSVSIKKSMADLAKLKVMTDEVDMSKFADMINAEVDKQLNKITRTAGDVAVAGKIKAPNSSEVMSLATRTGDISARIGQMPVSDARNNYLQQLNELNTRIEAFYNGADKSAAVWAGIVADTTELLENIKNVDTETIDMSQSIQRYVELVHTLDNAMDFQQNNETDANFDERLNTLSKGIASISAQIAQAGEDATGQAKQVLDDIISRAEGIATVINRQIKMPEKAEKLANGLDVVNKAVGMKTLGTESAKITRLRKETEELQKAAKEAVDEYNKLGNAEAYDTATEKINEAKKAAENLTTAIKTANDTFADKSVVTNERQLESIKQWLANLGATETTFSRRAGTKGFKDEQEYQTTIKFINDLKAAAEELVKSDNAEQVPAFIEELNTKFADFNKTGQTLKNFTDVLNMFKTTLNEAGIAADDFNAKRKQERDQNTYIKSISNAVYTAQRYLDNNSKILSNPEVYAQFQNFIDNYKGLLDNKGITQLNGQEFSNRATKELSEIKKAAQDAGLETDTLAVKMQKLFQTNIKSMVTGRMMDEIQQGLRQMYQNVVQIDSAMTELKKVTNETDSAYSKFLEDAGNRAVKLGASISDIVTASADFARLGYGLDDAKELADSAVLLSHVGDGFSSISEASESIISAMKGFGIEAKDSTEIIDKYNEVGNNFAISSKGIADAIQRSASALHTAGNSIDQSIGMVVAANDVAQDPDSVGNALKVLSLRIRGAKTELEQMGESTDDVAVSTSKLRDQIKALTNVNGNGGFDILTKSGDFKSTYDIMAGIAKVWNQMSDINKASLLEQVAGKNRANIVAGMLENWKDAEDAAQTASTALGSATKENETYLDSINGRLTLMSAAFEKLSTDTIDSGLVKWLVDFGTVLLDVADKGVKFLDFLGAIPTLAMTASVALGAMGAYKGFTGSSLKEKLGNGITGIKDWAKELWGSGNTEQIEADKEALIAYIAKMQEYGTEVVTVEQKQDIFNETLKDASAVAQRTAKTTDNLGDVMKAYEKNASVAAARTTAFKTAALGLVRTVVITAAVTAAVWALKQAWQALDENVIHPYEAAKEKAEEMAQAHKDAQQEVETLTQHIDELKQKMDACKDSTTGKIVDPESFELLEKQKEALEAVLNVKKELEQNTAKDAREAVYKQMDAKNTVYPNGILGGVVGVTSGFYGTQKELLNGMFDTYSDVTQKIADENKKLANSSNWISSALIKANIKGFESYRDKLKGKIENLVNDVNTQIGTLLNTAPEQGTEEYDEYEQRLAKLTKTQETATHSMALLFNGVTLVEQATNEYTKDVADGTEATKAFNEALDNGGELEKDSDAYKYAAELANSYGLEVDDLIKKLKELHDAQSKSADNSNDWRVDVPQELIDFFGQFTDSSSNVYKQTKALESAFKDMSDQGYLTSDSIAAILAVYPDLIDAMETENGVVTISKDILEEKFSKLKEASESEIQTQIDTTKGVIETISARISAYETEITVLQTLYGSISDLPGMTIDYKPGVFNNLMPDDIITGNTGNADKFKDVIEKYAEYAKDTKNLKDAQDQLDKLEKTLATMNNYTLGGFKGSQPKSSSSSNKGLTDAQSAAIDELDKKAQALKETYEAQKKVLEDQKEAIENNIKALEKEQKVLDRILKAVTDKIDKEIDRLEHQWDDLQEKLEKDKDNLDAAVNGANWVIEKRVEELEKANDALDESYQPRIDAIQDEIDKLNEANDAQEEAISLAQKKAALDAALAAKNVRVYREGQGFVWEANENDVKNAQQDYNDALREKEHNDAIDKLEKEKEALEKELEDKKQANQDQIDAYNDYKDKLDDAQNAYTNAKNLAILRQLYGADADKMILNMDQSMIDKITTDYMNNMSQTDYVEQQIEENKKLIDQLQKYKDKWSEVADAYELEQGRINAAARFGADWEQQILGQRTDILENFKNDYVDILQQIEDKTKEVEDLEIQIKVIEDKYNADNAELEKQKKELQWEKNEVTRASHATGVLSVSAHELANVDEAGPEIVVRQPEAGRYTSLEVGDGVVPGNLTRRLFSAAINPEAFVANTIAKRMSGYNMNLTSAASSGVHIGNISIEMNGVNDVENFGRILHQNISSIMAQEFSKR